MGVRMRKSAEKTVVDVPGSDVQRTVPEPTPQPPQDTLPKTTPQSKSKPQFGSTLRVRAYGVPTLPVFVGSRLLGLNFGRHGLMGL